MDLIGVYREVCSEARTTVDKEIKHESKNRRDGASFFSRLVYPNPFLATSIAAIAPFPLGLIIGTILHQHDASPTTLSLVLITMVFTQLISVLAVIIAFNIFDAFIASYYRWQRVATKTRDLWLAKSLGLDALKKAVELDIFFRKLNQQFFLGITTVLVVLVTLEKSFFGNALFPTFLVLPGVEPEYTFLILFSVSLAVFFSILYVPLQWSRQAGEFILKEAYTDVK